MFSADEKPAHKSALDAISNAGKQAKLAAKKAVGQA